MSQFLTSTVSRCFAVAASRSAVQQVRGGSIVFGARRFYNTSVKQWEAKSQQSQPVTYTELGKPFFSDTGMARFFLKAGPEKGDGFVGVTFSPPIVEPDSVKKFDTTKRLFCLITFEDIGEFLLMNLSRMATVATIPTKINHLEIIPVGSGMVKIYAKMVNPTQAGNQVFTNKDGKMCTAIDECTVENVPITLLENLQKNLREKLPAATGWTKS